MLINPKCASFHLFTPFSTESTGFLRTDMIHSFGDKEAGRQLSFSSSCVLIIRWVVRSFSFRVKKEMSINQGGS